MSPRVHQAPDDSRPTGSRDDITNEGVGLPLQREQASRLLPALVGRLGLEFYDRDHVPELPFVLWQAMTMRVARTSAFPEEEVALLRALAQLAEGWVAYDADGVLGFLDNSQWRRRYQRWTNAER